MYTYIRHIYIYIERERCSTCDRLAESAELPKARGANRTANLRTKILDFKGFDSSRIIN